MTLILSITSYRNRPPASPLVGQFRGPSISIGRGADNDWSLPDPEVHLSKKHCVIYYLDGQYTITDISTNGVFVNGSPNPLGNGGTAALRTGDRLMLGDYEVSVDIRADTQAGAAPSAGSFSPTMPPSASPNDPFGLGDSMDRDGARPSPFAPGSGEFAAAQNPPAGVLGTDWLREYDPVPRQYEEPNPAPQLGAQADHAPAVDSAYRPPNVSFDPAPVGSFNIPDNWQNAPDTPWPNPTPPPAMPAERLPAEAMPPAPPRELAVPPREFTPPARPAPPPQARETPLPPRDTYMPPRREAPVPPREMPLPPRDMYAPPRDVPIPPREMSVPPSHRAPPPPERQQGGDPGWRAFLDAAGLEASAFPGEDPIDLMRSLGRVFREMVAGMRDLLATRDQVKTEYRVQRTVIQAANNNPLKFAIDGVEAAALLLSRPKPGHLAGAKAVAEAFNDLKAHELAFMVGMQAAVTALLQEFDPASLKQRIDSQMRWDSLIPGARQSKYWSGYEEHYRQIASEISEDARSTFGLAFAKAYEEQAKKL